MNLFIRLLGLLLCGLLCESLKTLGKAQIKLEFWFHQFAPPYFVTDVPRRQPNSDRVRTKREKVWYTRQTNLIHSEGNLHPRQRPHKLIASNNINRQKIPLVWRLFKLKIRHNALLKLKSRGIKEREANWRTFSHASLFPFPFDQSDASTAVCDIKGDVPLKARHDLPFLDTLGGRQKVTRMPRRKNGKVSG